MAHFQLPSLQARHLSMPKNECFLIATEKLDRVRTFERIVVLLLRFETRHPQEVPFEIVTNCPLHKRINHMKPTNLDLETTFAKCSFHFGGQCIWVMWIAFSRLFAFLFSSDTWFICFAYEVFNLMSEWTLSLCYQVLNFHLCCVLIQGKLGLIWSINLIDLFSFWPFLC